MGFFLLSPISCLFSITFERARASFFLNDRLVISFPKLHRVCEQGTPCANQSKKVVLWFDSSMPPHIHGARERASLLYERRLALFPLAHTHHTQRYSAGVRSAIFCGLGDRIAIFHCPPRVHVDESCDYSLLFIAPRPLFLGGRAVKLRHQTTETMQVTVGPPAGKDLW